MCAVNRPSFERGFLSASRPIQFNIAPSALCNSYDDVEWRRLEIKQIQRQAALHVLILGEFKLKTANGTGLGSLEAASADRKTVDVASHISAIGTPTMFTAMTVRSETAAAFAFATLR